MAKIGLFYGSNDGHTEDVAARIKQAFDAYKPDIVSVANIAHTSIEEIARWDKLIFGIPTWNVGLLQDDWYIFFPEMDTLDLTGKQVAIFGLGDQYGYGSTFLDAVGTLADKVMERGGDLVGLWPAHGYEFEASLALEGDYFLGLALDEDHQPELTDARIRTWTVQLLNEFGLAESQPIGEPAMSA
ncbi:MAG TPA: flavodoxin [Phototrophicaceae bacterium]|nr:flavodoxin [Phototrophicaceae bacterium]